MLTLKLTSEVHCHVISNLPNRIILTLPMHDRISYSDCIYNFITEADNLEIYFHKNKNFCKPVIASYEMNSYRTNRQLFILLPHIVLSNTCII